MTGAQKMLKFHNGPKPMTSDRQEIPVDVAFGDNSEKSSFYATEIPRPLFWKPFGMFATDNSGSYDMSSMETGHVAGIEGMASYIVEPNVIVKHVETVIR